MNVPIPVQIKTTLGFRYVNIFMENQMLDAPKILPIMKHTIHNDLWSAPYLKKNNLPAFAKTRKVAASTKQLSAQFLLLIIPKVRVFGIGSISKTI
ncbi:MAG: hypothetical protein WCO98_04290 [bacterium]